MISTVTVPTNERIERMPTKARTAMTDKYAPCFYCRTSIETMGNTTFQFGSGWFPRRKAARGSHSATQVGYEFKFACKDCIDKIRQGIPIGQMTLFDMDES